MERDSVFSERVIWRGTAGEVSLGNASRAAFWLLTGLSVIAVLMAVAVASFLAVPVGGMILFAAWCATAALALRAVPRLWHKGAQYVVTDRHVVWKRGRFRRSIERAGISYARIHWYPGSSRLGDLELVRDVPTGALRRRLTILLRGVANPDRVWEIIRSGRVLAAVPDDDEREDGPSVPLGQRLAEHERVVWSGRPATSWRRFVPQGSRDTAAAALGVMTTLAMARGAVQSWGAAHRVLEAGVPVMSLGFVALAVALALTAALLFGLGVALLWSAAIEPGLRARRTHYLITNQRVLIAQGDDELHLDRSRIVDVIDAPADASQDGARDLFLVLDGPRSRAVALSGAFDDGSGRTLVPVLRRVVDADDAGRILKAALARARPRWTEYVRGWGCLAPAARPCLREPPDPPADTQPIGARP